MLPICTAPASGSGGKATVHERDFEAEMLDVIMGDETAHLKRNKVDEINADL